jgi:hypothetical protein
MVGKILANGGNPSHMSNLVLSPRRKQNPLSAFITLIVSPIFDLFNQETWKKNGRTVLFFTLASVGIIYLLKKRNKEDSPDSQKKTIEKLNTLELPSHRFGRSESLSSPGKRSRRSLQRTFSSKDRGSFRDNEESLDNSAHLEALKKIDGKQKNISEEAQEAQMELNKQRRLMAEEEDRKQEAVEALKKKANDAGLKKTLKKNQDLAKHGDAGCGPIVGCIIS